MDHLRRLDPACPTFNQLFSQQFISQMRLNWFLVSAIAMSGCLSAKAPVVPKHTVLFETPGKLALQFHSNDSDIVAVDGETIHFQAGHQIKIAGVIDSPCEVGDTVVITMELSQQDGKWSSCCGGAAPKIVNVKEGRGQFTTDYYLVDTYKQSELNTRLRIDLLPKDGGERRLVAIINSRIHIPKP